MPRGEPLIRTDISPAEGTVARIRDPDGPERPVVVATSSSLLARPAFAPFHGTARRVHIEGNPGVRRHERRMVAARYPGDMGGFPMRGRTVTIPASS